MESPVDPSIQAGSLYDASGIRPGTCSHLFDSRFFYRRGHCRICIPGLGAQAGKLLSYSVASVSGTILAVCSCTMLPLFAGIYTRGAGIGPATAFLYSGPAINVLAITLTAKILGWQLGLARGPWVP